MFRILESCGGPGQCELGAALAAAEVVVAVTVTEGVGVARELVFTCCQLLLWQGKCC